MQAAEYEIRGDILLIRLKADLDHHTSVRVRESADALLSRSGVKNILFDFSAVDFMDSSGIAVVLQTAKECRNLGCALSVCGVGKQAMRVLSAAGVPKLVPVTERGRTSV